MTGSFLAALAAHDVEVRDVEQVVIHGRLVLAVLLDLHGDPSALRRSVGQAAHALGMESEVAIADYGASAALPAASRSHVIVIGRLLRPGALSHVAQLIGDAGGNIESIITEPAAAPAATLEMIVRAPDPAALRAALVTAHAETGLDIAVEPAGLRRRTKRLVVLDVDSTLIEGDAIELLAERAGVRADMAAVTERAIADELDFAEALRARVALLAGLSVADLDAVHDRLRLNPAAPTLVRTLSRLGHHVGLVSGGFTFVTDRIAKELSLDFTAANELEVRDGVVTGQVVGPILDRAGKAAALRRFAAQFDVPLSQTVAIGDDANNLDMLEAAGLGVALNAESMRRATADTEANQPYLDAVLFVLGIGGDDVREAAAEIAADH